MDGLDNIRAALAEANKTHQVQSEQTETSNTQQADFVDEVVPHTSASKETMYSGK